MKLFIWDFHGVLEKNTERAAKEITNRVLEEFNVPNRASDDDIERMYGLQWINYFKELSPDSDEKELEAMNARAYEISQTEKPFLNYIEPMDFADEVLDAINKKGNVNILLSNCSQKSIDIFADSVKITSFFSKVMGIDNFEERRTKAEIIKELVKSDDFEKTIVIDDHPDGIKAGNEVNATTYLFSRKGKFPEADAHFKISDLREVLKEV